MIFINKSASHGSPNPLALNLFYFKGRFSLFIYPNFTPIYEVNYFGFVYIWYDRKQKMYYIGSHIGHLDDKYPGTNRRLNFAQKKRPEDFKRRIIYYHPNSDRKELYNIEAFILQNFVKEEELNKRYFNLKRAALGNDSNSAKRIVKKMFEDGKHVSQQDWWPDFISNVASQTNKREVEKGTHIWLKRADGSSKGLENSLKSVANGTHNFQKANAPRYTCEYCGKENIDIGNYHKLHGENCLKNPNISEESLKKRKMKCEFCGKETDPGNFKKHHGDNCKLNPKNIGNALPL